jgi:hypothetical protein
LQRAAASTPLIPSTSTRPYFAIPRFDSEQLFILYAKTNYLSLSHSRLMCWSIFVRNFRARALVFCCRPYINQTQKTWECDHEEWNFDGE